MQHLRAAFSFSCASVWVNYALCDALHALSALISWKVPGNLSWQWTCTRSRNRQPKRTFKNIIILDYIWKFYNTPELSDSPDPYL